MTGRLVPPVRGIRWNRDLEGFEMRCFSCVRENKGGAYWPLTLEFWSPQSLQRCRACKRSMDRDRQRKSRAENPEVRERDRAYHRIYDPLVRGTFPYRLAHTEYQRNYKARQKIKQAAA